MAFPKYRILLAVLMGWQFTIAEFTGGPLMIAMMVLLFKVFLTPKIVDAARQQAERGVQGRMEGHAAMDMCLHEGTIWQRMTSENGRTAIKWVSLNQQCECLAKHGLRRISSGLE